MLTILGQLSIWRFLHLSSYISFSTVDSAFKSLHSLQESMLPHIFMPSFTLFPWNWMLSIQESAYLECRPERTKDATWGSSIATKSLSFPSLLSNTSFVYYFEGWEIQEGEYQSTLQSQMCGTSTMDGVLGIYSNASSFSEPAASREDKASPWIPRTPGRKL